ncbi:MAG: TIR domain-containing protein, partial [Cyanobium sp.]
MSAIFISYTGRDPEGDVWADRLAEWFREWGYGFFRDQDHSQGIKAGEEWRQTLYRELGLARALVCVCSKQYDSSPWCVGEVAIAVKDGKTVIPIQLAATQEEHQSQPLPLLLQAHQAIQVAGAANPSPEQLAKVKQRLRQSLQRRLNWRDLQSWDGSLPPYPGLPAFKAEQAPVFFGRDAAIEAVVERLSSLALRAPAFLLLLGASGYGKSSLVRAGVVPRLRGDRQRGWQVLAPFSPGGDPFAGLRAALAGALDRSRPGETQATAPVPAAADWGSEGPDPLRALQQLRSQRKAPVLLVIDQFEELLSANPTDEGQPGEGERFLAVLRDLLSVPTAGLLVLATMRTDFLAPLQSRWPALTALASPLTLEPIAPADFGELITGPAERSQLTLQPGLAERLVAESGGGDALPLLAFTLEKLWKARERRGGAAVGPRGERCDLTVADYEALG